jgi:putative hemolysin
MIWSFLAAMIVAFFFAGLEAGLTSVNRIRLRQRAREGQSEAIALDELLRHPGRLLTAILILNLLARILVLSFLYVLLAEYLPALVALLLLVLSLPALALILECLPKIIFRQSPYRRVLLLAGILRWLSWPLAPIGWVLQKIGGRRFDQAKVGATTTVTAPAELREAINSAAGDAVINPLQKHYLHSVLNTRTHATGELSQPLTSLPSVAPGEKVSELLERAGRDKQDVYLVKSAGADVDGVVFVFDLLLDGIRTGSCQSYMRRLPVLQPQESPIIALLKIRAARASLALVEEETSPEPPRIITARSIVSHLLHGSSQVKTQE